ncbi:tetratricopeptide repeat protein, partial [bacterium]|nr:tetratricopeptide repeat protein [bacterium]
MVKTIMKTRHAFVLFSMFAIVFLLIKSPIYAHPSDHVKEAYRALSAGDLEKAETNLQKARFLSPGDARIQYDLGIVLYRKRDYSGAAKQLEFASKSTENSLRNDALHNLGNSFYRCGEFAKAVKAYTGALEVEENDQTRYNLEQAQKRLKEENERQSQLSSQPDQNKKGEQKDKQDQQSGSSGDQQKNGQNQGKQNRSDGRQGDEAKDQSGKEGNQPQNSQGEKPQGDNPSKDKQASGSREFPQPSISSGTNDLNEEQQKERSDVAMK